MATVGPPTGMRDVLPQDFFVRDRLIATIRGVYESYGYVPIDTPAVERLEVLTGKAGDEAEQLMFKILKRGDKLSLEDGELADLGLRYDLTVALCRFYATHHHQLPRVLRRYHIGPVWRADRPQRGRYRELYQCDVDLIGEAGHLPECEVILATAEVMRALSLDGFEVSMSDRRLLPIVLGAIELSEAEIRKALVSIDKLDKIGVEGVLAECARYLSESACGRVRELLATIVTGGLAMSADALGEAGRRAAAGIEPLLAGLRAIADTVGRAADPPVPLVFAPSLVRGMSYYTGPIFEIRHPDLPFSLAGGGRYDGLVGVFLGRQVPACGFSLGFERVLLVLAERQSRAPVRTRARVLIAIRDRGGEAVALTLARQLRAAGIATEVHPRTEKIARQFEHASQLAIPWILVPHGDPATAQENELIRTEDRSARKGRWPDLLAALLRS